MGGRTVTVTVMVTVTTLEPSATCRKKLRGRIVTVETMAREALRLSRGSATRSVPPMSLRQIAARLGYKDKASVRALLELAKSEGYERDAPAPMTPARVAAAKQFGGSLKGFQSDPAIAVWVKDLATRGKGGTPLKSGPSLLAGFRALTVTLGMSPSQWLEGESHEDILAHAKASLESFLDIYYEGGAKINYGKDWKTIPRQNTAYNYAKSLRSFLRAHQVNFPLGDRSVTSAAIDHIRGKYADIRMSVAQYMKGQDYIEARCGIDSDAFRWFTVGFESMARSESLWSARAEWREHVREDGRAIFIMVMIEQKTININEGKFTKYIWGHRTQRALEAVKGGHVIRNRNFEGAKDEVYPILRDTYEHLGLTNLGLLRGRPGTSYFLRRPSHSLRHCGAQFQLALTNFNYSYVAAQGWTATAELEKSYGRPPPEFTLQTISGVKLP